MLKFRFPVVFSNKEKTPEKKSRNINIIKKNIIAMANTLEVMDEWLEQDEIDKIDEDASVISAVSLRKSATLKKELLVTCEDEHIKEHLERRLNFTFRQQALDTPLQGFSVFELVWEEIEGQYFASPVERNYQEFTLKGTQLIYKPDDIKVPEFKAITGVYSPKFNKPMGRPLYKTLFWLVKFKNASVEFWLDYMERFSSPWIIGTTDGDKDEMAENLYAMLAGDVAVIEEDDKVDLKTPEHKGDFLGLSKYSDNQIRVTIAGATLLGENSGGSYAAAKEQNEVREDVAMTDEQILISLISQYIHAFKQVNNYTKDLSVTLKDKDKEKNQRAERDLKIHEMTGGKLRPTKEYLEETYQIRLEEIPNDGVIPNSMNPLIANKEGGSEETDYLSTQMPPASKLKTIDNALLSQMEDIFANAESYDEALEKLLDLYDDINFKEVNELLSYYIANAHIFGSAEIEDENPKG